LEVILGDADKMKEKLQVKFRQNIFPVYTQNEVDLSCTDSKYLHIFTDGGGNCGKTSIGIVVVEKGIVTTTFGAYLGNNSTNNIAELTAIHKALRLVKHLKKPVRIYSDSAYAIYSLCRVFNGRKNTELINEIIEYIKKYPVQVEFVKIKGHTGIDYNDWADSICSWFLSCNGSKK